MLAFSILLCSCEEHRRDNNGFPKSVSLLGTGDKKIISGDAPIFDLVMEDAEFIFQENTDSIILKKEWLTIKCVKGEKQIEIIAEQNTQNKVRKLKFGIDFFSIDYGIVQVTQNVNMEAPGGSGFQN